LEIQHLCSGPVRGNFSSYSGNLTLDFGSGVSFFQGPRAHRTFWPSPFALNWPAVIFPVEFFHSRHFGQKTHQLTSSCCNGEDSAKAFVVS